MLENYRLEDVKEVIRCSKHEGIKCPVVSIATKGDSFGCSEECAWVFKHILDNGGLIRFCLLMRGVE